MGRLRQCAHNEIRDQEGWGPGRVAQLEHPPIRQKAVGLVPVGAQRGRLPGDVLGTAEAEDTGA